jgi:4-hydroxybenzoate polyprenyltransferase
MNAGIYRSEDWWKSKAVLLMGLIYLLTAWLNIAFERFLILSALSFITIVGFASMGYFLNDFFDIEYDNKVGKKNFLANKPNVLLVSFFLLSCVLIFTPWIYLPSNNFSYLLIFVQILLYVVYSTPPIRLKERGIAGVIADALYGHAIPHVLAAHTFSLAAKIPLDGALVVYLFTWQLISGIRNIVLHQKADAAFDQKSGTKTFVQTINDEALYVHLKYFVLLEMVLGISFFIFLAYYKHIFLVCLIVICIVSIPVIIQFKNLKLELFFKSKWMYFPNNLFEQWMPIVYLFILSFSNYYFLLILCSHIFAFQMDFYGKFWYKSIFLIKYVLDLRIGSVPIKHIPSLFINNCIFFLFLVIGVNLKNEKTSALGYLKRKLKNT